MKMLKTFVSTPQIYSLQYDLQKQIELFFVKTMDILYKEKK